MAFRVFKCRTCGHKMRFSGGVCGNCLAAKEVWQTPGFYVLIGLVLIGLIGFALV